MPKRDSPSKFRKILRNTLFTEHLLATASVLNIDANTCSKSTINVLELHFWAFVLVPLFIALEKAYFL